MDLIMLDSNFDPIRIITSYKSLVWSIKSYEPGEVELVVESFDIPEDFKTNPYYLVLNSHLFQNLMEIETIFETKGDSNLIKVKGVGFEEILKLRYMWRGNSGYSWPNYHNKPSILAYIFSTQLVNNQESPGNSIPGLQFEPLGDRSGTIARMDVDRSLFDIGLELLGRYPIVGGFTFNQNDGLWYKVRTPSNFVESYKKIPYADRAVIFDRDLGNLENVERITSKKNYRNIANIVYTNSANRDETVMKEFYYKPESGPEVGNQWLNRRVAHVDATDMILPKSPNTQQTTWLRNRVNRALDSLNYIDIIQGDVTNDVYSYGVDYEVGDYVQFGANTPARVDAVTLYSDSKGVRIVPTIKTLE